MKLVVSAVVSAVAVIALAGCATDDTAPVSSASVTAPTGADLVGTWTQSGAGFEGGVAVTWDNQTVVIEKADGQGFAGFKEYTREGEQPQKETLSGVVGLDGNVLIVDDDGTFEGRLADGKLEGQYAEVGKDAAAINVVISKQ